MPAQSMPAQPAPAQPVPGQSMPSQPASGQPASGQPAFGQPAFGQSAYGRPAYGQTAYSPAVPGQAVADRPASAIPYSGGPPFQPVSAPASPGPFPDPFRPASASHRHSVLAVLVVVLFLVAGAEGFYLYDLNNRLDAANSRIASAAAAESKTDSALQARIKALEQVTAGSLDSTAVATAVLPSVFRVDAGDFTGTAFAVGQAPSGGGTDLLTNYHVVQSIYEKGTRDAALERDGQRFPVKIIQVDTKNDLALLQSTETFHRLTTAAAQVEPGSPIVVVGAPLGLAQSVTTGVVSALRNDFPGEGGKTFIQFDAPINPGNSGGPVVNAQKQVVGIASAKADNAEGIGLAIPIAVACHSFTIC
jgi:hypothetical protein